MTGQSPTAPAPGEVRPPSCAGAATPAGALLVGAHVSTRGGIDNAVTNAVSIGADVMQIHPRSAMQWRPLRLDEEMRASFLHRYSTSSLRGLYLHAVYLINLATPREDLLRQSVDSLVHQMEAARRLNADALVVHPGSHLGAGFDGTLPQVAAALAEVLERSASSPARLLVENSAGSGGCIGCSFEEVGRIVDAVDSARMGVCLDTQHLFASGYDIRTAEQVEATLERFGRDVGFDRLALVHANDSRTPLASNVDRHANIGEGQIGIEAFGLLLGDQRLRQVPWILEVPGVDRGGPDRDNLNRIRACAGLPPRMADEAAPRG